MKNFLVALTAAAFLLTAAPELQQTATAPEISTQVDAPVFQSKVTLIEVPVVVRDKNGSAVGGLRQEDFQLFDKGKPQVISKFSIEKSGGGKEIASVPTPENNVVTPPVIAPDHFVGLLFDDIHITFPQLVYARTAAQKFVASSLRPADRVAIFTTSGRTYLDFTDDRDLLHETLMKLALLPRKGLDTEPCPTVSVYQADQMINWHNDSVIAAKVAEVRSTSDGNGHTCFGPQITDESAKAIALNRARAVLDQGRIETNANVVSLKDVSRRLTEMPGQRTLLFASPGFIFMQDQLQDEGPVIDLAIRSGVVINALDVKGVSGAAGQFGVLHDLASGTGGRSFHENDLTKGLEELGAAPEVFYLLGFSPQNLKLDGTFHSLKVNLSASLKTAAGMSVEARRGYYPPTHLASADEDAKEEVTQALFSRDEMNDIPVEINTRFFKASESEARLSVTSRVDVRKLHFRKADGRDVTDLRVVCALFDRNGNYVQSVSKTIQMRLLEGALQNERLSGGISVRSDFTVPPGTYVIRLVLRDSEGQSMTAQNRAVRIP